MLISRRHLGHSWTPPRPDEAAPARCVPSGVTIFLLSSVLTHDLLCFEKQKITYFEPTWAGDSLFISCLYPFAACMALSFRSGIGSRGNYLYLASGRDEIYCYLSYKALALILMNAFGLCTCISVYRLIRSVASCTYLPRHYSRLSVTTSLLRTCCACGATAFPSGPTTRRVHRI